MRRLISFLLFNINISFLVFASPADPTIHKVIQPNGDTISISLQGDEYGSWYEDAKGDIIALNSDNYWVYISVEDGKKILTNQVVSQSSLPININRDSVSNFVLQKRKNNYIKEIESSEDQTNSRAVTGKLAPLPTTGVQKILTVLVQFEDVKFQNQTGIKNLVNNMMNQENYRHVGQSSITGSLRDFYLQASYNQLDVRTTVIGPYTVSHNMAYYGAKTDSENDKNRRKLAREVMEMIADDIDVGQFDNNNDGWVECIHILYAGNGNDEDTVNYSDAIWPHQWNLATYVSADGVKMSRYIMTPEKYGNYYRGIGTTCHELGHILGAPDFYDRNYEEDGEFEGTGDWDLMGGGSWNSYSPNHPIQAMTPAHPNPYIKTEIFGWATATELSGSNKLYTLRASELDKNSIYKLSTSTPGEYYLLENRQGTGLPGPGLVIYHVNAGIENVASDEINIKHPQNMYVVDASNHIAKPTGSVDSYGNINNMLAPFWDYYSNNIYFTSTSEPSNCAWDGTPTQNKDVCFISEMLSGSESFIKFVLNPEIEGPDVLCDSAIYSLKHVPAEATIEWDFERYTGSEALKKFPFTIVSGQGTKNAMFKRGTQSRLSDFDDPIDAPALPSPFSTNEITTNSTMIIEPYKGARSIYAHITFNGNRYTLEKRIYMPNDTKIDDTEYGADSPLEPNSAYVFSLKYPVEENWESNVRWTISDINGTYTKYGNSVVIGTGNSIAISMVAEFIGGCSDTEADTILLQVIPNGGVIFQNPASGSVEISVISRGLVNENDIQTMAINQSEPYMGAYRLELWHTIHGKVREMDLPENNPTTTMNLDGLSSGIYVLRLIIDNQIVETSQMIINQ